MLNHWAGHTMHTKYVKVKQNYKSPRKLWGKLIKLLKATKSTSQNIRLKHNKEQ
jgi:hypothetical protein